MTVRVYRSSDTGTSNGMNNAAGTLIPQLDLILVNGYSLGTVSSITRSGSTATLTFSSSHGMATSSPGNRLTIAGCTQTEYNGEFLVTVTSSTQVTYTVSGTPTTPATGSPTCVKAGSGWTKAYSGTNSAAYRQGTGSNGFYLRIDDSGSGGTARAVGYETMSDVNTGTNAFPTNTQVSGGLYIYKSNAGTVRSWIAIASEKWLLFRTDTYDDGTNIPCFFFGDFTSYNSTSDIYSTLISGNPYGSNVAIDHFNTITSSISSADTGCYMPRSYTQTGTAVTANKHGAYSISGTTMGAAGTTYPDPVSGNLLYSEVLVGEPTLSRIRGNISYLLYPLHNKPLADMDTFTGTGIYADKTFLALNLLGASQIFIQIAGPGV